MNIPQKILDWYDKQPRGKTFKLKSMLDELKIISEQFKNAKKSKSVNRLFHDMKTNKRGVYKIKK